MMTKLQLAVKQYLDECIAQGCSDFVSTDKLENALNESLNDETETN